MMLSLSRELYRQMLEQAQAGYPEEICGLVAGRARAEAVRLFPLTNTDKSREHYNMDPKEQFTALKIMRGEGLTLVGIYHSHPDTPARLSEEDLRLAYTPDVSYLVLSLAEREKPALKSYRVENGAPNEEEIVMVE